MSRSTASRLATTGGLALATVFAGLALAPSASAATLPALDLPESVKAGEAFVIAGEGCTGDPEAPWLIPVAAVTDDLETSDILVVEPDADGTWAIEYEFPAGTTGDHEIWASCLAEYNGEIVYDNEQEYPLATVAVTGTTGAIRGAEANTPGTKAVTTDNTSTSSAPGQKVVRIIEGFQPFEEVTLVMHSTPVVLGTFTADANGVLTASFTLPAGATVGTHTLVYEGTTTYFQESFTVTAKGKQLAYTGADVTVPLTVGIGLVLAGAGALYVSRRRPAGAPQV